jgi:CheY-like chemotaxis protein
MNAEILVVDDSEGFARNTADFLTNMVKMPVAHAATSRAATDIVEQQQIAVAVLDQRMEGDISGTELFLRLRHIRPEIRAIMLTGQAEGDEVGHALTSVGFNDYLSKTRIADLPTRVLRQYLQYIAATAENRQDLDILVWPSRRWRRLWQRFEIRIQSVAVVEERVVNPDSFRTLLQVNAGEERKLTRQLTSSTVVTLEESSQNVLKASLSLNNRALVALTTSLENALTVTAKNSLATTQTAVSTSEQSFKLPEEPSDAGQLFIRARHFQAAPVTRKIMVTVLMRCRCCQLSRFLPLVMVQETGLVATRQQDHMSDGTVRENETGDISAAISGA